MRVMLATDGSSGAEEAAWLLSHLPHHETLELIVLTVIYVPEIHGAFDSKSWREKQTIAERSQAEKTFSKISEMFQGANVRLEHVIVEGQVGTTIVKRAARREVDLIVLGARGNSMLDRLLLGSTSDYVANHAECSVLIIRPTGLRQTADRRLKLCVAYDDSEPARHALNEIGEFGWGTHTHIDIVSAISFMGVYTAQAPVPIDTMAVEQAMREALQKAVDRIRHYSPDIEPHVIEADHLGQGLVKFTQEHGSDLVVLGSTGKGMLGRLFLGSVSRYVLRHAECSVWISRKQAE